VTATIEDDKGGKKEITVERVISAVGVVGNIEGLGLEDLGVKIEKGVVAVDGYGRTSVAGIYAIGDVAGPPMLAHKASHEGVACVEKIKGARGPRSRQGEDSRLHLLPPADRVGGPEREGGQGGGPRGQGRPLSVPGQRQGDRARRRPGHGENRVRCQDGQLLGAHLVGPRSPS
jgi:dihydrolipoamide dehydrogenase